MQPSSKHMSKSQPAKASFGGREVKGKLVKLFGRKDLVQLMGRHSSRAGQSPAPALSELEERCALVLEHLQRVKPGSVTLAERVHRIQFDHDGMVADLTVECVAGSGIVVQTPMAANATGRVLRTPRVSALVDEVSGGGPMDDDILDFIADEYENRDDSDDDAEPREVALPQIYEFGQGWSGHNQMFQMEFVNTAPGPAHKHLRYTCWTVAELACFFDFLLKTPVWDSVTEAIPR